MLSRVDLPEPEGPMIERWSPLSSVTLTSSTARTGRPPTSNTSRRDRARSSCRLALDPHPGALFHFDPIERRDNAVASASPSTTSTKSQLRRPTSTARPRAGRRARRARGCPGSGHTRHLNTRSRAGGSPRRRPRCRAEASARSRDRRTRLHLERAVLLLPSSTNGAILVSRPVDDRPETRHRDAHGHANRHLRHVHLVERSTHVDGVLVDELDGQGNRNAGRRRRDPLAHFGRHRGRHPVEWGAQDRLAFVTRAT